MFLAEHVMGQFRIVILVVSCWIEAIWFSAGLNMLVDIPHCYPNIQNLVMGVLVGVCAQGFAIIAFNPGCCEMCVVQTRVLSFSLSGNGRENLSV